MVVEVLFIAGVFAIGLAALSALGFSRVDTLVLAYIAGLAVYIGVASVVVLLGLYVSWSWVMSSTALLLFIAWAARGEREGGLTFFQAVVAVAVLAAVVPVLIVLIAPYMYIKHVDSMEYLAISGMLEMGTLSEGVSLYQLQKRMLSVPLMHVAAAGQGELFLVSVTPLIAVNAALAVGWLVFRMLRAMDFPTRGAGFFSALAVIALISNNRFWMHALYLNGHLFVGVLMLLLVGFGWFAASHKRFSLTECVAFQMLLLPALIVARPEGGLLAGLAILPTLLAQEVSWRARAALLACLGALIVFWQGFLLIQHLEVGREVSFSVLGLLALGFCAVVSAPALALRVWAGLGFKPLWVVEISLWVLVGFAAAHNPDILLASAKAAVTNQFAGGAHWGGTIIVAAAALLVVLLFIRFPHQLCLRLPVTGFVPLVLLLAYLRDAAYRVGGGDSLNRMLIQILPLVIVLIAAGAAGAWLQRSGRKRPSAEGAPSGLR